VNQDGRPASWPRWIKQLFRSLIGDPSQFTPEERHLSQLAHVAASLSILILWWAFFQLVHGMSMARYQEWQICENNLSPANGTQISLSQQQDQINGMIDALRTTTPSQKVRLRQQIAEIIRILDSDCQAHLFFASQRMALGLIGTAAAIVLTVTFGHTASKGLQQANRLTLNLGGTALIVLTTIASISTFINDSNNTPRTGALYLKARTLLNTFATDLVNASTSIATPAELDAWMKAKDQAIHPLLLIQLNFNDTPMDEAVTKGLPNTPIAPLPAAPAPQPAAAAQP
jgi:hypothetical protein